MAENFDEYLARTLDELRDEAGGEVEQVPAALAEADPGLFGAALCTTDGEIHSAGDDEHEFTIQSVSKAFVYAIALEENGIGEVLRAVDVEPSGEAYNVVSVEPGSKRPRNPMINAGALTIHGLVAGAKAKPEERVDRIVERLSAMAGRKLTVDEDAAKDELAQANRNLAIAHMLRAEDVLPDDPFEVVTGYTRQCSILVTVRDLATMAATLANGGYRPGTEEQIVPVHVARQAMSVMMTCGMYDSAGDWMSEIGIPAKSGIAGSIVGALPGRAGLATYSPRLDAHGTSVRGRAAFERLSDELDLHLLDDPHRQDTLWHRLSKKK